MNCKQCGAPMSVEKGQDFFHCRYCGGYEFPDPNQDGVALLEEISAYVCPLCKEPLVSAVVRNVHILACPRCRGNLIEQSKMLPILRQTQPPATNTISEDLVQPQDKTELTRTMACPSCQKAMAVYPYGGPGNLIIQGCEQCQLIWLDFGELSRIICAYWEMYNRSPDELGAKKKWIGF
jgi:Zn-finger nucleic acid-binding protein